MNGKQYKNVIDWTMKHDEKARSKDSLAVARAIFKNMGVALPQGDCQQVLKTLKTNDYMGWRACTMEEAQVNANGGIASIGINENRVAVVSA